MNILKFGLKYGLTPVSYTYKFNGINNYIHIPSISLSAGDTIYFKYISDGTMKSTETFLSGKNFSVGQKDDLLNLVNCTGLYIN